MNNVTGYACPVTALSELFALSNQQLEATLSQARTESPVTYLPDIGYWAVSKYDDVKRILGDTENFSAEITLQPLEPFTDEVVELLKERKFTPRPTLSNNTRDDHSRIRRHTQIAFAPRRMQALEPYIRQLVDKAVSEFIEDKRADLVAQCVYEMSSSDCYSRVMRPPRMRQPTPYSHCYRKKGRGPSLLKNQISFRVRLRKFCGIGPPLLPGAASRGSLSRFLV